MINSIIDQLDKDLKTLNQINNYQIEIGVIAGKSKERKIIKADMNNAELLFIQEEGSPARNIPKRPVLDLTLMYANYILLPKVLDKCTDNVINNNWKEAEVEKELKIMCMEMENFARDLIYDNNGAFDDNALSTQVVKGIKKLSKKQRKRAIEILTNKENGDINNKIELIKKRYSKFQLINHPLFDTGQLARSITCRLVKKS